MSQYLLISPQIFLAIWIVVVLLVDLYLGSKSSLYTVLTVLVGSIVGFILNFNLLNNLNSLNHSHTAILFDGAVRVSYLSNLFNLFIFGLVFILCIYSRGYFKNRKIMQGEFYLLILTSALGAMILISANSLLTLYLGLELMSLPLYALIAIKRNALKGPEAAMKYFVMGAVGSGFLLFGMTFIYATTHTFDLLIISHLLITHSFSLPFILGLLFILVAIGFKLGAVPFHMWTPDVYEGAPLPVTAFISTVPKLAIVMLFVHLFIYSGYHLISQSFGVHYLFDAVLVLGVLSILIGNLFAVVQTNIKRLFAYSTIAHMGFVLLALSMGWFGESIAIVYILIYAVMSMAGFGVLILLSQSMDRDIDNILDLKGLSKTHGFMAFALLLVLFSMAGIPPFIGFMIKFKVIWGLMMQGEITWSIFALIMSVIAAYYYLRVIKTMYFDAPESEPVIKFLSCKSIWDGKLVLLINSLGLLILGIFPALVLHLV